MRLAHLLSKDRSKGCVSGKLSCVKNPAPGRWKTSDGELVHRKMDPISRGGQGAKRLRTESVRNAEHFETVPDLIELSLSGGDARRGNTRSHPEHDG